MEEKLLKLSKIMKNYKKKNKNFIKLLETIKKCKKLKNHEKLHETARMCQKLKKSVTNYEKV